jgi:hypothetical protein
VRTTANMGQGINKNSKVQEMLKQKIEKQRYGTKVDIENYPTLKAEKKVISEELENKIAYRDRLKNIEQTEIKREMQEKLSQAKSQGDLDLIRKNYTKKLFRNSLNSQSDEMKKAEAEVDILKEKLNDVDRKLNYINAEYADQIRQLEDERVKNILKEGDSID